MTKKISVNKLTLGELAYFERRTGQGIGSLDLSEGGMIAKPLIALVGIALFRSGEYATPDEAQKAAENIPMDEAIDLIDTDGAEDAEEVEGAEGE